MFISEARLTRAARNLTRDPYAMHRTLTFALQQPRVLWALPSPDVLIVQADTPLRPANVPGIVDYVAAVEKRTAFTPGSQVEVAGIVNPTYCRVPHVDGWKPGDPHPRGKRQALAPTQWPDWALGKLEPAITVDRLSITDHGVTHGRKPGHRITTTLAAMHATGTVRDPGLLTAILLDGLGPAKSMGAGLILCKEIS